jgi:ABC-type nitrate/sulfonate/bicarbonate transport system substrate-binding protein
MCFGGNPLVGATVSGMTASTGNAQAPSAPKDPNLADLADMRKKRGGMSGGGTLLTGATGIENSQLNLGRNSLLGS